MGAESFEEQPVEDGATTAPAEGSEEGAEGAVQEPKTVPADAVKRISDELDQMRVTVGQKDEAIRFLQMQLANAAAPKKAEIALPADDEVPTMGEIRQLMRQELGGFADEVKRTNTEREVRDRVRMQKEAKARHADFDEVWALAEKRAQENPQLGKIIMAESDPWEAGYLAGTLHPEYLAKTRTKETQAAGNQIAQNLSRQRGMAEIGGGGAIRQTPKYADMALNNPQAFDDLYNNIVYGTPVRSPK